jgi:hypothetical protein
MKTLIFALLLTLTGVAARADIPATPATDSTVIDAARGQVSVAQQPGESDAVPAPVDPATPSAPTPDAPAVAPAKASDNCAANGDVESCKLYLQEVGPEEFKGVMDIANQNCYEEGKLDWINRALDCRWAKAMQQATEPPANPNESGGFVIAGLFAFIVWCVRGRRRKA